MSVVLAQPHRRGSKDPFCESPLGRFVLRHGLDRLCYDIALDYAQLVRCFFAAKGVPQATKDGHRTPDGARELTAEAAQCLQNELEQIEEKLRGVSRSGLAAMRELAVFEREAPLAQAKETASVLRELVWE
jgi:hypothetical protein